MLPIPRSVIVATASVAAGGALFGAAAGGMVGIDRDLQATAASPARIQTVEFLRVAGPGDCPPHPRHRRSDREGRV